MVAYLLEAGLVLTVVPWTAFWERNYFITMQQTLRTILLSPWLRGAVSGIGLATLAAGLVDLFAIMIRRSPTSPESAGSAG